MFGEGSHRHRQDDDKPTVFNNYSKPTRGWRSGPTSLQSLGSGAGVAVLVVVSEIGSGVATPPRGT